MANEADDEKQTEYEKETEGYANGSVEQRRERWYFPELPLKTRQVLWALSEAEWVEWESLAREMNPLTLDALLQLQDLLPGLVAQLIRLRGCLHRLRT